MLYTNSNWLIDLCGAAVRYFSGYQTVSDTFDHFNQILFFSTDFHKSPKISSFTEIRPVGVAVIIADGQTGGRLEGHDEGSRSCSRLHERT